MVAKLDSKISSEVKNTATSQVGRTTTQIPHEQETESNGSDKQRERTHQNPPIITQPTPYQSSSSSSPTENAKVDTSTTLSQEDSGHSSLEIIQESLKPPALSAAIIIGTSSCGKSITTQGNVVQSASSNTIRSLETHNLPQKTLENVSLHRNGDNPIESQEHLTSKTSVNSALNVRQSKENMKSESAFSRVDVAPASFQTQSQHNGPLLLENTSIGAPLHTSTPKSSFSNTEMESATLNDDAVQKLRAPLVNKYGSFVHPTDTSLADARTRLLTALEQTRVLRSAFTDRVYEKYRVLLRPVPKSMDEILANIKADPIATNLALLEQTRIFKEEKETEKKQAHMLAAGTLVPGDGAAALSTCSLETAEQLAYIGAGLNLVILPEDDIDEHDIGLVSSGHRGPTNPQTGQRVAGISAAAASAAEVLLDRVRRAGALRVDRQQSGIQRAPIEVSEGVRIEPEDSNPLFSSLHVNSTETAGLRTSLTETSAATSMPVASKTPKKSYNGNAVAPVQSSTCTGKNPRSRSQVPNSSPNQLSLNPSYEEIPFEDVTLASTKALIFQGVGSSFQFRSQNRFRHPHPDSLGGRNSGVQSNGRVVGSANTNLLGYPPVDLPPISVGNERRLKKPVKIADRQAVSRERVLTCLDAILKQFATSREVGLDTSVKSNSESMATDEVSMSNDRHINNQTERVSENYSQGKRCTTEIGLLRGMQHPLEEGTKLLDVNFLPFVDLSVHPVGCASWIATSKSRGGPGEGVADDRAVEPILVFSVLHALGLVRGTPITQQNPSRCSTMMPQILFSSASSRKDLKINTSRWPAGSTKLQALCQRVVKKRCRFTETFFQGCCVSESAVPPKRLKSNVPEGEIKEQPSVSTSVVDISDEVIAMPEKVRVEGTRSGDVLSIRGGGGEDQNDVDCSQASKPCLIKSRNEDLKMKGIEKKKDDSPRRRENSTKNAPTSPPHHCNVLSPFPPISLKSRDSSRETLSLPPNQTASLVNSTFIGSPSAVYTPPRNGNAMMVAARQHHVALAQRTVSQAIAASHERFHNSTAALHLQGSLQHAHLSRIPGHHGSMSDFFGGLHASTQLSPFGNLSDWSPLDAANSVGLFPTNSSLAMELHQHAAMVNLSVDRAARAMLVREHQNAAVVAAAHRQAAVRASTNVSSFSPQQTVILMGQQGGSALFQSSAARFSPSGNHQSTPVLSSPAAPLLSQSVSLGAHLQAIHRASGSRPGSSSSTMSGRTNFLSSTKERSHVVKGDMTLEDTISGHTVEADHTEDDLTKKRKMLELTQSSSRGTLIETVAVTSVASNDSKPPTSSPEAKKLRLDPQTKLPHQDSKNSKPNVEQALASNAVDESAELASRKMETVPENDVDQPNDNTNSTPDIQVPVPVLTVGMKFSPPRIPDTLDKEMATEILQARIHIATQKATAGNSRVLLDFIQAVGAAVPIPKALVAHPLKERLASSSFKGVAGSCCPSISREVVAATVLIWLWVQHKESFQRAFSRSGRIDVDPDCKWLIQAAVDTATRALAVELAMVGSKPLTLAAVEGKSKCTQENANKIELHFASTTSKALMTEMCIDEVMDTALPVFDDLVELLDEARLCALRSRCSERCLLAALFARSATMSESFSHSYVASMVRAGEALGHGELFELVQDEKTLTSTLIPYDIFSDENGAWEDPCRLSNGFTPNLTGEDLLKRAHARAMIQKSLRKMQDRNNIRGGTTDSGPYAEPAPPLSPSGSTASAITGRCMQRTPSVSLKKRSSFTFSGDATHPGSGFAPAKSMAQYNPHHTSSPLVWDSCVVENSPYGKHVIGTRPRAFSLTKIMSSRGDRSETSDKGSSRAADSIDLPTSSKGQFDSNVPQRSTDEVKWVDVAKIFESVNLEDCSSLKRSKKMGHIQPNYLALKKIIAPFCRKIDLSIPETEEDKSDFIEDLSDEHILFRHQEILEVMKAKLDKAMENRPLTAQQRARNRAEARRNACRDDT